MAKLEVDMHPANDVMVDAEKEIIQKQANVGRYISWINATIRRSAVRDAWHTFSLGFSREEPTEGKPQRKEKEGRTQATVPEPFLPRGMDEGAAKAGSLQASSARRPVMAETRKDERKEMEGGGCPRHPSERPPGQRLQTQVKPDASRSPSVLVAQMASSARGLEHVQKESSEHLPQQFGSQQPSSSLCDRSAARQLQQSQSCSRGT